MGSDGRDPTVERARLVRALSRQGPSLTLTVDGRPLRAEPGDTVLTAVLADRAALRTHEFDGMPRAGFCLMGACQDCWVWLAGGRRIRACTTPATEGLAVATHPPEGYPGHG